MPQTAFLLKIFTFLQFLLAVSALQGAIVSSEIVFAEDAHLELDQHYQYIQEVATGLICQPD